METTIETNNNDEINVLRVKLEVVEKELQIAISRAEKAENDAEQLRNLYKNSSQLGNALAQSSSHELAAICSHCGNAMQSSTSAASSSSSITTLTATLPPPPPPPMPNFKPNPVNIARCNASLKDGITAFALNNPLQPGDNASICSNPDVKKSATGRFAY